MDNLDKVRARQKTKSEKNAAKKERASKKRQLKKSENNVGAPSVTVKKRKRRKRSKFAWVFTAIKIIFLLSIIGAVAGGVYIYSLIDFTFGDDLSSMNLNMSSNVYYTDATGKAVQYAQFDGTETRVWVPVNKMPPNLKNAFVAIEDQRFFSHSGVDIKRTLSATLNYIIKGDSSYGGSTITQQLVKNITADNERTKARKIREMLRALVLETKMSKEQILEMYMNTIYLSQGVNGVEAASNAYFSKSTSELNLVECAAIAGITQFPAKYDPITQPEANKRKRKLVLDKMLELDYITKAEHKEAVNAELEINPGKAKKQKIQSYFLDHLFEELQGDLVAKGYTKEFAANVIYNGGLKIYSTVDPDVQNVMEDYFESDPRFPTLGGSTLPQGAMVISDPKTGEVKGIVGGRGSKDINRGLNRATQSKRQPGSSIKPIAVYAPAIDLGLITPATSVDDSPLKIGNWTPKNANNTFRGYVSVTTAVTYSYNIPAVRVLEEVSLDKSYDYLKNKLHITTLVDNKDKEYSTLALGGLTDGVTVMEMNAAYSALANGGEYITPHTYTKVYDADGALLLNKSIKKERAFKKSTAYIMSTLLKNVTSIGTAAGSAIPNIDTCGKTGTTDKNRDRWFVGYTPYYCGSVWFGYDKPQVINSGSNPALTIWKDIMSELHSGLPAKSFAKPSDVVEATVCQRTGHKPGSGCYAVTQLADSEFANTPCTSEHNYIGTYPYMTIEPEETEDGEQDPSQGEEDTDEETTPPVGEETPPAMEHPPVEDNQ